MQDKEIVNALTIIRDLGIKLGVKESELQKLQALCKEKDAKFESEIAELRSQIEKKDVIISGYREGLQVANDKIAELHEEARIAHEKKVELDDEGNKKLPKIADLQARIKMLKNDRSIIRAAFDNLSGKSTASISNLTKKNDVMQDKVDALTKKNVELQTTIDQMMDSYQERADTSSAHIDSYEEDIERLQDEIHELRTEKQDMISALQKIVSEFPHKKVELGTSSSSSSSDDVCSCGIMMKTNLELFGLTDDVLNKLFSLGHTVITGGAVANAVNNQKNSKKNLFPTAIFTTDFENVVNLITETTVDKVYYNSVPSQYHASSVYKFDARSRSCFFSFHTDSDTPLQLIIYEVQVGDSEDWACVLERHNVYNFLNCYFDGKKVVVCDKEAVTKKTHFALPTDELPFIDNHKFQYNAFGFKTVYSTYSSKERKREVETIHCKS